jgi:hypothetical protein
MKTSHRNLAMILMGIVALSTSGVYSLTSNAQTQTGLGTTEHPAILGHIVAVVKDNDGNIIAYRQTDNLVMSNGKNATSNVLFGSTQATSSATVNKFQYVGVGTSATAVAYTDTGLGTQRGNKVLGTVTNINSGGGSGMGAQIASTWAAGKLANNTSTSTTIQEAGLFDAFANATASSNMYAHQVISPGISMGTGDTLTVTWKITFS